MPTPPSLVASMDAAGQLAAQAAAIESLQAQVKDLTQQLAAVHGLLRRAKPPRFTMGSSFVAAPAMPASTIAAAPARVVVVVVRIRRRRRVRLSLRRTFPPPWPPPATTTCTLWRSRMRIMSAPGRRGRPRRAPPAPCWRSPRPRRRRARMRPLACLRARLHDTWAAHAVAGMNRVDMVASSAGGFRADCPTQRLWVFLVGHLRTLMLTRRVRRPDGELDERLLLRRRGDAHTIDVLREDLRLWNEFIKCLRPLWRGAGPLAAAAPPLGSAPVVDRAETVAAYPPASRCTGTARGPWRAAARAWVAGRPARRSSASAPTPC